MSNGQVYQFESVRKYQKESTIHEYIGQLVQQKEQLEIQSAKTMGVLHSYVEGKLFVLNQVLEELTKILYNYQKF